MEDHLHVAIQLMQAQRFAEARQVLKQFTKQQSKNADGWFLLGQLERTEKHYDAAIAALRKAQALNPQALVVTEYLAMTQLFSNDGRAMLAAIDHFATVLKAAPESPSASAIAVNLQTLGLRCDAPQKLIDAVQPFYRAHAPHGAERLRLAAGLAMAHYVLGDVGQSKTYAEEVVALRAFAYDADNRALPGDYPYYYIYAQFILGLLAVRAATPGMYAGQAHRQLHAIGESHCLTPAHLVIHGHRVQPHLLMGAKAYYFGAEHGESWRFQVERILASVPKGDPVVVMFGEIDCRATEGIMQQWLRDESYDMEQEVAGLVARYVKFVKLAQLRRHGATYLYGVPAPARTEVMENGDLPAERHADFVRMIAHFNTCLAKEAEQQELPLLDVYAATRAEDGWARPGVHLDGIHLQPQLLAELLQKPLAG